MTEPYVLLILMMFSRPLTTEVKAVSELEDLEAIRRLTHEYAMAVDTMQLDALMDLFLPEAVVHVAPLNPPSWARLRSA